MPRRRSRRAASAVAPPAPVDPAFAALYAVARHCADECEHTTRPASEPASDEGLCITSVAEKEEKKVRRAKKKPKKARQPAAARHPMVAATRPTAPNGTSLEELQPRLAGFRQKLIAGLTGAAPAAVGDVVRQAFHEDLGL
eukprot:COSAG04_NODE_13594_length_599_cov_1.596000_1_plen_140_part_10